MTEFITKEFIDETSSEEKVPVTNNNKICVFSPDYDGCLSSIICERTKRVIKTCFPIEGYYGFVTKPIKDLVEELDKKYKTINVVCGSARQNVATDNFNRKNQASHYAGYPILKMKEEEGSVFTDLENFVTKFEESKTEWGLWKLLFPDKYKEDGSSWKSKHAPMMGLDILKKNLIKFQIIRGIKKFGPKFDFVFVDDREDILSAIKEMLEGNPEWLPSTVSVYLYRYDFFEIAINKKYDTFGLFTKIN